MSVNGIFTPARAEDWAIDEKSWATWPSMPRISFGPALLKLSKTLKALVSGVASALKSMVGCAAPPEPPNSFGTLTLKLAVASFTPVWPTLWITLMPAFTSTVRSTFTSGVVELPASTTSTRLLSVLLVRSLTVIRLVPRSLRLSVSVPPTWIVDPVLNVASRRLTPIDMLPRSGVSAETFRVKAGDKGSSEATKTSGVPLFTESATTPTSRWPLTVAVRPKLIPGSIWMPSCWPS